ncbi:DUF3558 domain-containing protein [Antrihabitans spumae]|uniref:DUF3558 domain-containing protein n=1 Tax=Antrihabitans spumae TaxID=3373370 RepID=A0ABW7KS88_9NOCA
MKFIGTPRVLRVVGALAVAAGLLTGCSQTIDGTPRGERQADVGEDGDFRNLLEECQNVTDQQIAETVGGNSIDQAFYGAICRWDVGGPSGPAKVTFNWYETGSLEVERKTLEQLKYVLTEVKVQGRRAIQQQRPNDPDSCGVTAGAPDTGIIGWWVNYQPGNHPDPCTAAIKLAELTLNLSR